jgi:hypothetical protein
VQQNRCSCVTVYNQQFALIKNKKTVLHVSVLDCRPPYRCSRRNVCVECVLFIIKCSSALCQPDCTVSMRQSTSRTNLRSYTRSIYCSS